MANLRRHRALFIVAGLVVAAVAYFPAKAQFGGGGFGGGGVRGKSNGLNVPVTFGTNVGAVLSPEKDRIWAYSGKHGHWVVQSVDLAGTPKEDVRYVVGVDLVSLQTKAHVYAFSARTGQWAALDVPQDAVVQVQTHTEWVSAAHGDTIANFSATTGRWSALNWKTGKVSD